jgi:phosphate transport system permease protein
MIEEGVFHDNIVKRNRRGKLWSKFYLASLVIAIVALITLFLTVVDQAFGTVSLSYVIDPSTLADGRPLDELSNEELAGILTSNITAGRARIVLRDNVIVNYHADTYTKQPIQELLPGRTLDPAVAEKTLGKLSSEEIAVILTQNLSSGALLDLAMTEVVQEQVLESWQLGQTLFRYDQIVSENAEKHPEGQLQFRSWLNTRFLTTPMASEALKAGVRTALLGSLWIIGITIFFALPVGIGAAVYLEEYARAGTRSRLFNIVNNMIEINIRNLAGVPSIIYGMLGLFVFVRLLGDVTQGRTILSAGLTMALLILPVIIINAQEAIRAVPYSIREASYGMGATRWQTVSRQVLPAALPGIMTGTILGVSRAVGETAPLIVVGAATFIVTDPGGVFSQFTALPIQVYQWTSLPQAEFRYVAAAAIVVLLILLLSLNATAIILRNRFSRRLS